MAEIEYGCSGQETINLASDYAMHMDLRDKKHPLSACWLYNFLNRWTDLKSEKPRSLEVEKG